MKNFCFKIFGVAIGLIVLFWLITSIGLHEFLEAMKAANISDLTCAFSLIFCGMFLRVLRWRNLFLGTALLNIYPFFSATMIGALANNVLPARGGDLVRVYILGKQTSLSKSRILATVLLERLSELLFICFMSLLVVSILPIPQWIQNIAMFVGSGSFVGLLFLILLSKRYNNFSILLNKVLNFLPKSAALFFEPIIRDFIQGIKSVLSKRSCFLFITLTLLIWGVEIGTLWFFARAFGFVLSFLESWLVMIHAVLACFVPLVPAQIGVWEFSAQSGMTFLGYEGPAILTFVFVWHFSLIFIGTILGTICLYLNGTSLFVTYTMAQRKMQT
jgi:uncharacterized protein (TIRG00374 family)